MILGEYWYFQLMKPGLGVSLQCYAQENGCQLGSSKVALECSVTTKVKLSLVQLIGGICNTNLVVFANIVKYWKKNIDIY